MCFYLIASLFVLFNYGCRLSIYICVVLIKFHVTVHALGVGLINKQSDYLEIIAFLVDNNLAEQ